MVSSHTEQVDVVVVVVVIVQAEQAKTTVTYKNNPMQKHLDFDKKVTFSKRHFYLWLEYFNQTVDKYFIGKKALDIKTRAQSIATIMQVKMNLYQN